MRIVVFMFALLIVSFPSWGKVYSLKECVEIAIKNSPKVRAKRFSHKVQEVSAYIVLSDFFPRIFWNLDYSRNGGSGIDPYNQSYWELSAQWEIFSGFSTLNSYRAERYLSFSEAAELKAVKRDVALNVVEFYTQAFSAKMQVKAAKNYVKSAQYALRLAQKRYQVGLAPKADVLHARAKLKEAEYRLIETSREYDKAKAHLASVMGMDVFTDLEVKELKPVIVDFSKKDLVEQALAGSYRLASLKARIEAEKRRLKAVYGEFMPKVTLSSSWGETDQSLFPDDRAYWSVGVSISFPLFTGLSTVKKLKMKRFEIERLKSEYRSLELQVQDEVWSSYMDYEKAKEKLVSAESFFEASKEDVRIMRKKYAVGLASIVDLTSSQATLYDAESSYYRAISDLVYAYYKLVRYVGKIPVLEELF